MSLTTGALEGGHNLTPLYLESDKGKGDAQRRRSFSACYN